MIHRRLLLGGLAAGAAVVGGSAAWAQADPLHGSWSGALDLGSAQLRLKLDLGEGKAVLYSLDQGGAPIPGEVVSMTAEDIHLSFPMIQGSYRGKLVGDALEGEFTQGASMPLRFVRAGSAAAAAPVVPLDQGVLDGLREQAGAPALIAGAAGAGAPKLWVTGVRAAGSSAAATTGDLWHIGSITKSMTATLVGRMVEAGKVAWDEPLAALLPALAGGMRDDYRKVTLRHLLSHRAGLLANLPGIGFGRDTADPREERLTYARMALSAPPAGAPEHTFTYSNAGYVVAGAVLEQRLGKPWEALIQEHLFQPLGIRSAGFGAPGRKGEAVSQPVGHAAGAGGKPQPYGFEAPVNDNPAVLGPAGRVHMTVADLLTFASAHRDRTQLLKTGTWDTLHTPPFGGDYALGWVVRPDGLLWHNGSNTLWYAELAFDRKARRSGAAIANDGRLGTSQPAVGRALKSALAAA